MFAVAMNVVLLINVFLWLIVASTAMSALDD